MQEWPFLLSRFVRGVQCIDYVLVMKTTKPMAAREVEKLDKRKKKRELDDSSLKLLFGKGPKSIWDKDIYTGEGNVSF